jgi:cytoskeletal protein CcmA (bactofilin family)
MHAADRSVGDYGIDIGISKSAQVPQLEAGSTSEKPNKFPPSPMAHDWHVGRSSAPRGRVLMAKWRLRSKDSADSSEIVGFIGEGTVFTGDLVLEGGARIDGRVVGRVTAPALLVVGPSGEIEAEELRAYRVTVCGTVRGKLIVQDRLEIQSGGRVCGHLVMEKEGLIVAPGGIFEGAVEYVRAAGDDSTVHAELATTSAL